ncbi:MAG: hypothetical protein ACLUB5_01900 [Bifidobacterium dentium]
MMKPRKFRTFGGFIILIAILRSVTNQLEITPTHLFELGEAFCPLSKNFSTFLKIKKAACFKFEVNRWRVEIFIFMMYNM